MKDTRPNIKLSNWDLHKKLKVYAATNGLNISQAIEKLIEESK